MLKSKCLGNQHHGLRNANQSGEEEVGLIVEAGDVDVSEMAYGCSSHAQERIGTYLGKAESTKAYSH